MKCNKCSNANICLDHIEFPSLSGCTSGIPDRKVPTNADKIRSMSDEELAEWINSKDTCEQYVYEPENTCMKEPCINSILNWLQTKAE